MDPNRTLGNDVEHDGSCLYHCIAELLRLTRPQQPVETAECVRRKIERHIRNHWERLQEAHPGRCTADEYFRVELWGGDMEIDAASELYFAAIYVWHSNSPGASAEPFDSALQHAHLHTVFRPIDTLDCYTTAETELRFPAWDLFLHNSHYQFLVPTASAELHWVSPAPPPATSLFSRCSGGFNPELSRVREEATRRSPATPSCNECSGALELDADAARQLHFEMLKLRDREAADHALALALSLDGT